MRPASAFLVCSAFSMLACAKAEKPPADATTDAAMAAPMAPALAASDISGTWNMASTPAGSDSATVNFVFNATGDPSTWTFNFPGRPPVPVTVIFDGDSMMSAAGPYESVIRKGVQVTTSTVSRLQGGSLIGATTARYAGAGADSVLTLTSVGTRAP